ncbi:hypothetical protein VNO77_25535 [Canavalia gladiata]|uniref:Protein kinase domain-containing protein n=1 Tax=Canavalia gladiata TaxID=3824 RepID=A0AAN9LDF9_CANGL
MSDVGSVIRREHQYTPLHNWDHPEATMVLKLVFLTIILILCPIYAQYGEDYPIAKDSCNSSCGDVDIPYPFGMKDPRCYADKWFEIECRNRIPYLKLIDVEVTELDVSGGTVEIQNPIFRRNCGKKDAWPVKDLRGGPFVYSQDYNKFVAKGCNTISFLLTNGSDAGGCVSICDDPKKDIIKIGNETECNGKYCCETLLPSNLQEYNVTITGLRDKNTPCSYALIVKYHPRSFDYGQSFYWNYWNYFNHRDYRKNYDYIVDNRNDVPAVLEWEIVNSSTLKLPADKYAECYPTSITSWQHTHSGRRCSCKYNYVSGNPYIAGGCTNRHKDSSLPSKNHNRAKWIIVGVSSGLGSIIFLLGLWLLWRLLRLFKVVRKKIVKIRREKLFKQNGGLLLEQRMSSGDVNVERVKHFSLKELEKATDKFNINRVLGKGGQGTVYKGMLVDGKIVAVKKFKVEGNVEEFINEFVVLSQINHRNVVKLLGCCLETKIPLLVYEFIPNGNLFEYLHEQNEELPMTWDMRLRIATEVAGALFYLHSAASLPVYHRDIKSTNILLDEKYKAKVADFGTSRMVSIEATHLTTVVQGTFGYLDPEYFHTSQFTEKSDVYSFGVVLAELLTGQKPISFLRPLEAKSLAPYFILCMEENRLFDIIDERVLKEGNKEHIITVAILAGRCLELNGKKRPTMKEVTLELEGIWKSEKMSPIEENLEEPEFTGIQDYESWAACSTASDTATRKAKASTLEVMPILINNC